MIVQRLSLFAEKDVVFRLSLDGGVLADAKHLIHRLVKVILFLVLILAHDLLAPLSLFALNLMIVCSCTKQAWYPG